MSQGSSACSFSSFDFFLGFDWATRAHVVVVVDREGAVVYERMIDDDADGWRRLAAELRSFPNLAALIETSSGANVERLLDMPLTLYAINPKAAERFRDRKSTAGVKSDRFDAWTLADALRTDGHGWKPLQSLDPLVAELRLLCRDEIHLIEWRTALSNQLRQALKEYYPAAIEAFDDWTTSCSWHFLLQFPTPGSLANGTPRQYHKFFRQHRLTHAERNAERVAIFIRADQFQGSPHAVAAKSRLAQTLARQLIALQEQLDGYRARIEELYRQHGDHHLFDSLPGVGTKLGPRLLGELGDDRARFDTAMSLQAYSGAAPVTRQSGKHHDVRFRRACNMVLRATVHHWANLSRETCAWAETYYRQKRRQGKTHAAALRCLALRWLKILWKMWVTNTPYNEAFHTRNQVHHGSWVLTLAAPPDA
jgi:transposase